VVGALDLLFVILAVTGPGPPAGLGRLPELRLRGGGRSWPPRSACCWSAGAWAGRIVGSALLLSGALAALAAGLGLAGTVALLTVAGGEPRPAGPSASRSLLQRSVPAQSLGPGIRPFSKGSPGPGLAIGSVLVPVLVHLGGSRLALARRRRPCCRLPPRPAAAPCSPWTPRRRCRSCRSRCLRSLPLFAELPAPAGRRPCGRPSPRPRCRPGAFLIRQGRAGRCLLCDRRRPVRRPPGRALPAALAGGARESGDDRAVARRPPHCQRRRPGPAARCTGSPGEPFPDRGTRPCRHPATTRTASSTPSWLPTPSGGNDPRGRRRKRTRAKPAGAGSSRGGGRRAQGSQGGQSRSSRQWSLATGSLPAMWHNI